MSYLKTVQVFCDGDRCNRWQDSCCTEESEAWEEFESMGWEKRTATEARPGHFNDGIQPGEEYHLCRRCAKRVSEQKAEAAPCR